MAKYRWCTLVSEPFAPDVGRDCESFASSCAQMLGLTAGNAVLWKLHNSRDSFLVVLLERKNSWDSGAMWGDI